MNIGLEFENADGYIFDNRIAATLKKNKIIGVNIFEIKLINYSLEFDESEADMESNNNITVYELELQLRENFCMGKNVKLFANMKKINKQDYIKNYEKFQMVYKNMDNQYSMCEMIDRKFEVIVRDKSNSFVGRFFNGWSINGLEGYVEHVWETEKTILISISSTADLTHIEMFPFMVIQTKLKVYM
jgi:hypothetical protein